jgi:hypothetical protein
VEELSVETVVKEGNFILGIQTNTEMISTRKNGVYSSNGEIKDNY